MKKIDALIEELQPHAMPKKVSEPNKLKGIIK